MCTLDALSTELLIKIFNHLDIYDLCNLRQTCKRFNQLITYWDHVFLRNEVPLVTNQSNAIFLSRCYNTRLSPLEKMRISKNWSMGLYREKSLLPVRKKYIPWLCMNNKIVWISRGRNIFHYERNKNHIDIGNPRTIIHGRSNADVGNFQVKNNFLVCGQRDGSMWLCSADGAKTYFDRHNCHDSDIASVDISPCGSTIVSGSRNNTLKIWGVHYDSPNILSESYCHTLDDRVWRVSLSNEKPLLAVGTSGHFYIFTILIYDLERMSDTIQELSSLNYGMGVLDIKWDSPHTLWSCGYDSRLRKWDLRTGNCEQIYRDPYGAAVYCLDYDYCNTVMTGTQLHGRVVLWDIRQPKCSVQMYFMRSCQNRMYHKKPQQNSSPVYSLAFDSQCLFTATDQHLNALNFSIYNGEVKDYSDFCK